MDILAYGAAVDDAKLYTEAVALSGVPINYPTVNPVTKTWRFFDPTIPGYVETTYSAIGQTPEAGANGNWWVGGVDTGIEMRGPKGEAAQFQVVAREGKRVMQYKYASQEPKAWTDLYAFAETGDLDTISNAEIQQIINIVKGVG